MPKLLFTRTEVDELAKFCKENSLEAFFLSKDEGVYICATVGSHENKTFKNCIQYADGCHPLQDENWYENSRHLCGGDDFSEIFEASLLFEVLKDSAWKTFIFDLTPTHISVGTS
ncbi:hypothetical protein TUMSATVNIG1_59530 (plasmid) [Vibrio nigripulchritudo]|uniref:DUF3085 domain-containing protein n=1 Tax=Vibrio nigripulchritudo TaxID=28173 RepID=UPI00190DE1E0|nr:DUF3085 domain-containing protein [Vibrio nigripulchritudo]BCL73967.1 hypothetical protein VNTUMSATTG_59040 [Vibrio nigripulchritudo]BDU35344.1 hypothetical protein TUMSATVNIG1_59530 [Vibrio nigripulchritudo]